MECLIQAGLAIDRVREAGPAELPDLLGIAATKR